MIKVSKGIGAYKRQSKKDHSKHERMKLCRICGKQTNKGSYCISCENFIRKMQKRDQA